MDAINVVRTISEIAAHFEVHLNCIVKWKNKLLENVSSVFSKKKNREVVTFYCGESPHTGD